MPWPAPAGPRPAPAPLPTPWWSACAATALLSAAAWLRTPVVPYLVACAAATVATLTLAMRRPGLAARAAALVLVACCALAAFGEAALRRVEYSWDATASAVTHGSVMAMDRALNDLADQLQRAATAALDAPSTPEQAFARLAPLSRGDGERGIVLYRDGVAVAWGGSLRTAPDTSEAAFAVVRTPFYVSLQATVRRERDRAVASALLHAEPPADRLSHPLDQQIAARTGVDGFTLLPMSADVAPDSTDAASAFAPGGIRLLIVRPIAPQPGEAVQRVTEVARSRCALALAVALIAFLAAEWRGRAAHVGHRLAALAVPLATLAIVPLNAFSNVSRLFDPTFFFSPVGGPYSASVGALGVTGAIALLAALGTARARARLRPRWLALLLAIALSAATPFAVLYVAGGITPPGADVPLTLWVGWQVALALAGAALLVAAGVAARGVLPPQAGLPTAAPLVLAAAAATLGPLVWVAPAGWPLWYAIPWGAAALASAFTRQARWRLPSAAVAAALGSAVVVWGTTAAKRVVLAERDLAGLSVPDPDAVVLLDRLGAELAAEAPPSSRADLLSRYARSDLAAASYPTRLALWAPTNQVTASLELARFEIDSSAIAAAAADARRRDTVTVTQALGSPGVQLVLAVPARNGTVTTVIVAPQTRLITDYPSAPLLGVASDPGGSPPYTMTVLEVVPRRSPSPMRRDSAGTQPASQPVEPGLGNAPRVDRPGAAPVRWTRKGSALHGDWLVPSASGPARAHTEVELRSFDALAQRAVLLVVLDMLAVSLLWGLSAIGDGVLGRWTRAHARRWARSYRTQLTIVLFTFFVLPAILFAVWSYRRLRSDDVEDRKILVWQTLRAVAAAGPDTLPRDAERVGTPLLLYENGELRSVSDSLYDQLAPIGRYLSPDIQLGLGIGDEVRASRPEQLGGAYVLFGYRAADKPDGQRVVLAAPARGDEVGLETRWSDLSVLVLFTTVLGAAAALWLSGLAARRFARPIDALRRAALAVAAGQREPDLEGNPPLEFAPVFAAFRRMAADFGESQRVLAWGEMARQVAHEIKNPLTPIRLGIQHLKRARAANRQDFDRILDQNADRILAEIDRLDEIARAFSRYGSPVAERAGTEPTDIAAVVNDVLELERLGAGGGIAWGLAEAPGPIMAAARGQELREVLLNVLENARLARAQHVNVQVVEQRAADRPPAGARGGSGYVMITVEDDGDGIPADVLPRIFEPHFSTRTSGSGLGLAVSRRIVHEWGGKILVHSEPGRGTRVTIVLLLSAT